jgi:hypothetical protein
MLLLACSRRKRPAPALMPAVERYDGPAFRVLRRYMRSHADTGTRVSILSARYGLISPDTLIVDYDETMTAARAAEMAPIVADRLRELFDVSPVDEVLVRAGATYRRALGDVTWIAARGTRVRFIAGPPGVQLAILRDWLGGSPACGWQRHAPRSCHGAVSDAGWSADDARMAARRVLAGARTAHHRGTWAVPIDGSCVPVKPVVAELTGWQTSAFHTDTARRLLTRLGVPVVRVGIEP